MLMLLWCLAVCYICFVAGVVCERERQYHKNKKIQDTCVVCGYPLGAKKKCLNGNCVACR